MATNHLGPGTVNVPINLLAEERHMFGHLAVNEDRSLSDMIRRLAVDGLRQRSAEQAERIEALRRGHRAELINREHQRELSL
jgi:hypothetical protein